MKDGVTAGADGKVLGVARQKRGENNGSGISAAKYQQRNNDQHGCSEVKHREMTSAWGPRAIKRVERHGEHRDGKRR